MNATYLLPIRRTSAGTSDLPAYLTAIAKLMPVIVVDGSPRDLFDDFHAKLPPKIRHVPVDGRIAGANGKVRGVLTGLRLVETAKLIIADDDVRYDEAGLARVVELLESAAVVRPQNVFEPMPWHALLDTGRSLIARALGGDWPGTLGVRTAALRATGGYSADVLFENLELVRTLEAAGERSFAALDCYVKRRPPSTEHYLGQRVRQAYDEFARPRYLIAQLLLAPAIAFTIRRYGGRGLALVLALAVALAERGRRIAAGRAHFPAAASAFAPLWVAERALLIWVALFLRMFRGGVRYGDTRVYVAAHSPSEMAARAGT